VLVLDKLDSADLIGVLAYQGVQLQFSLYESLHPTGSHIEPSPTHLETKLESQRLSRSCLAGLVAAPATRFSERA
jgi:hypothetical protein